PGRKILEDKGYNIYSLARISKLGEGIVEFVEE
ncbi:MAG: xanthine phosphoribosyltransferase, partial [Clostridiaceae bacterium]|nr:xanthine phosphoribosyltransferase [Clostridiaceae bacterium]